MEIGHQNYDKKFELELELFLNLGPPERQCVWLPQLTNET